MRSQVDLRLIQTAACSIGLLDTKVLSGHVMFWPRQGVLRVSLLCCWLAMVYWIQSLVWSRNVLAQTECSESLTDVLLASDGTMMASTFTFPLH